jgi:hypothetical protein
VVIDEHRHIRRGPSVGEMIAMMDAAGVVKAGVFVPSPAGCMS